jgi:hypothetical protein
MPRLCGSIAKGIAVAMPGPPISLLKLMVVIGSPPKRTQPQRASWRNRRNARISFAGHSLSVAREQELQALGEVSAPMQERSFPSPLPPSHPSPPLPGHEPYCLETVLIGSLLPGSVWRAIFQAEISSRRFRAQNGRRAMKIFKAAKRSLKTCGLAVIASDPDKASRTGCRNGWV